MRRRRRRYYFGEEKDYKALIKNIVFWVLEILFVIALAGILVYFIGMRVTSVGQSMSPTLENGETILVNRLNYKIFEPKPNDIIVFSPNGNENSHYYIKRVIACPGDTVLIKDGVVYVNGEVFEEVIADSYVENGYLAEEEITVGDNEYFVLGDNRGNSEDSRYANVGNVKKEHIVGEAWFIISPFGRLGFLE